MVGLKKYTCSFCGRDIEPGTGINFVRRDGVVLHFCSSKCRKNMLDLGRKPRKIKWTNFYEKGKSGQ
ncbi:MAG: 50S ribosomal protein L24e [Candidatus Jordarchaeales archaeon]